ncbi:cupin domain-containing protein [Candidatus Roizmanbacteria bacterium]|nr:cupin domain-containing protein [Candidatus Roizmanbacteria bacterium]
MKTNCLSVEVVNIDHKLSLFNDYWSPKIVGRLNDHKVQLAKLKGEFVWHHHDNEDELFLVIKGKLIIHFSDRTIVVNEGELVVIPHPVEHKPEAPEEVHILLIEPENVLNTGNISSKRTVIKQEKI